MTIYGVSVWMLRIQLVVTSTKTATVYLHIITVTSWMESRCYPCLYPQTTSTQQLHITNELESHRKWPASPLMHATMIPPVRAGPTTVHSRKYHGVLPLVRYIHLLYTCELTLWNNSGSWFRCNGVFVAVQRVAIHCVAGIRYEHVSSVVVFTSHGRRTLQAHGRFIDFIA
jgi:hypothetical protein